MHADTIVTGAGMAGSAIAQGLADRGQTSVALNVGDLLATRATFGLDWAHRRRRVVPDTESCCVRSRLELLTVGEPAALDPPGTAP